MKKTFTKQFALLTFLLGMSSLSKAQYMCTDINPDTVVTLVAAGSHTWNIDINNDNIKDFQFSDQMAGPNFGFLNFQAGVATMSQNYVLVTGSGSISALAAGSPIASSSTSWQPMNSTNPNFYALAAGPPQGGWAGQTDKYVGVAVAVATNTFYGWIKMSTSATINSYTVKEYGYNSVAGASIAAGQACASASFAPTFTLASPKCKGDSLLLTANTGSSAVTGYTWSSTPTNSVVFSSPNSSNTLAYFYNAGTFTITLAATSGSTATYSQTITINPTPTITVASTTSLLCKGSSAVLTASGATTYSWNNGPTTSTISISPTVTTVYVVTGTLNGCKSTAVFTQSVINCTGLTTLSDMEYGFTLFPNPVTDKLNIRSNFSWQKNIEIVVTDLLGKVQLQEHVIFQDQTSVHQLNLSTLPKGVYFVKLQSETGSSKVIRILKE